MKRNHTAAHENHERWLVSYADFITLLFAFFVVMFASTQADKNKAKPKFPRRCAMPSNTASFPPRSLPCLVAAGTKPRASL